jgi:hypothetical protein
MAVTVVPADDRLYGAYVATHPNALLYYGLKFRNFLVDMLGVRPLYRMAVDASDVVVGVLPVMASDGPKGTVLNSLPFFGSHGGVLADTQEACAALIDDFNAAANGAGVAAATVIANPLDAVDYAGFDHEMTDSRIGQFTPLPQATAGALALDDALMALYHQKTRNMVRKGMKSVSRVSVENDAFDFLRRVHRENMSALGGIPKPDEFFELVPKYFNAGDDFDLFVAEVHGERAAALLVFYCNGVCEYYTPAVRAEARNSQALSLVIHHAMTKASERGCRYWNWGGTWSTQHGVYQFKSRWGTEDKPYKYYTKVGNRSVLDCSRADLLREYPFTYVIPFGVMNETASADG